MNLLRQIRIAVIGMPDVGKSTFIGSILKEVIGKTLSPDTLMNEVHWSDGKDPYGNPDTRTIKCAKIFFKYKDVEFCFYDCPGHKEYSDQIEQGINGAHCIIQLYDNNRMNESESYFEGINLLGKPTIQLVSHAGKNIGNCYDANDNGFKPFAVALLNGLYASFKDSAVDVEQEALDIINDTIDVNKNNAMFFSCGKDSLVGLDLLSRCGLAESVKVYFPNSGYDFKGVLEMIPLYESKYKIHIEKFDNSLGQTYEGSSSYEMLQNKAKANNSLIAKNKIDLVCVQYRASDEGVRSKDYHLRWRDTHYRFSPVFYFSESNIWRYIYKYSLPVCPLYYKGYRSLGDFPITFPCMPNMSNIEDIINYIDNNPQTNERDGRKKQDNSVSFAMEKLRNGGFF